MYTGLWCDAVDTVDFYGRDIILEAKGRHDPCVAARAVPIVESLAALVPADGMLQQAGRQRAGNFSSL